MRTFYILDLDMETAENFAECAQKFEATSEDSAAEAWAQRSFDEAGEGDTSGTTGTCLVSTDPSGKNAERMEVRLTVTVRYDYDVKHVKKAK